MLTIVLAIFLTSSLCAETLSPITVTTMKEVSRFSFSTSSSINQDRLETQAITPFSRAFNDVPGVTSTQGGGPGGQVSVFIRGTQTGHVAWTLDGLKLNDASNVDRSFDAAFLTSPFLRKIEVHKGPQAVLFGSDALGGVIEMQTRRGENAPETRLTINGGSQGTIDSSLARDWKTTRASGTVTATRFHTDGISRFNHKRSNFRDRDASDITQLTSSSEHRWEQAQTELLFSFLRGRNDLDSDGDTGGDYSQNDQYLSQQKTTFALSETQSVSYRLGFNRHQRLIKLTPQTTDFQGNLLQHELLHRVHHGRLDLLSGVASEHQDFTTVPRRRAADLHSAFSQSSFTMGEFTAQAGLRAERHSSFGNFLTGSSGLAFSRGAQTWSIQYSQGYKAPSLYQLYAPASIGNSRLNPEVNHSLEASFLRKGESLEFQTTLFQNHLKNLIGYLQDIGHLNRGRLTTEGIDLSLTYRQSLYSILLSGTHLDFRRAESTVLRRPRNTLKLQLSYFLAADSEMNLTGRWLDDRQDEDSLGRRHTLESYETFDLGYLRHWKRYRMGIQCLNLLNREYEDVYGFSVLPRSVFVHFGLNF